MPSHVAVEFDGAISRQSIPAGVQLVTVSSLMQPVGFLSSLTWNPASQVQTQAASMQSAVALAGASQALSVPPQLSRTVPSSVEDSSWMKSTKEQPEIRNDAAI